MEEKDREVWVGENRLYLGEDNTLYITIVGEIDAKTALAIKEADLKFKNMVEEKFDVLGDLNATGQPSIEARRIWQEMAEHEKSGKIAMFGMHPVARVISSFMIGVTKKKDMRFFKSKDEALSWLKE